MSCAFVLCGDVHFGALCMIASSSYMMWQYSCLLLEKQPTRRHSMLTGWGIVVYTTDRNILPEVADNQVYRFYQNFFVLSDCFFGQNLRKNLTQFLLKVAQLPPNYLI